MTGRWERPGLLQGQVGVAGPETTIQIVILSKGRQRMNE